MQGRTEDVALTGDGRVRSARAAETPAPPSARASYRRLYRGRRADRRPIGGRSRCCSPTGWLRAPGAPQLLRRGTGPGAAVHGRRATRRSTSTTPTATRPRRSSAGSSWRSPSGSGRGRSRWRSGRKTDFSRIWLACPGRSPSWRRSARGGCGTSGSAAGAAKGALAFPTLVVGTNAEARHLVELMQLPSFGFRPIGMVATDQGDLDDRHADFPVLGSVAELRDVIREVGAECVFVASSALSAQEMGYVAKAVRLEGVEVRVTATLPEVLSSRVAVQSLGGVTALVAAAGAAHRYAGRGQARVRRGASRRRAPSSCRRSSRSRPSR